MWLPAAGSLHTVVLLTREVRRQMYLFGPNGSRSYRHVTILWTDEPEAGPQRGLLIGGGQRRTVGQPATTSWVMASKSPGIVPGRAENLDAGRMPVFKEIDQLGRGAGEDHGVGARGLAVELVELHLACQRPPRLVVEEHDEIGDDAEAGIRPARRLFVATYPLATSARAFSLDCGVTNTTSAERAANRKAAST